MAHTWIKVTGWDHTTRLRKGKGLVVREVYACRCGAWGSRIKSESILNQEITVSSFPRFVVSPKLAWMTGACEPKPEDQTPLLKNPLEID